MRNQETELGWSLKMSDTPDTGRHAEPLQREKQPKVARESDHLIVLRDGRADHMGKGVTVMRIRQRKPVRDMSGSISTGQPSWRKYRQAPGVSAAQVSMAEKPGTGKPHAGICAGGTG
jgi:hypothetical protein